MIKNGIARILIGVDDLNESVEFYRDILQMSVVGEYAITPRAIEQLWNLPPETTGQAVCLKNDEQTTLLELIEFKPHSGKFIRTAGNTTDYGLFTIAFRAKNVDAAYESLKQKGYQFICPPHYLYTELGTCYRQRDDYDRSQRHCYCLNRTGK